MVTTVKLPAAICFDLDETLLDGSGLQRSIMQTCEEIARRQPHCSADELLAANTTTWQQYWLEVEPEWTIGALDGATVARESWRRTLVACGCADGSLVEFAAATHARLERNAHRLFDDAQDTIHAVRRRAIPIALVTNGAADTQRAKLDALGIELWFDVIVIAGEIGAAKPDITPFRVALEAVGVQPADCWHVGDSLAADVAGANAAGLTSVWLNRPGHVRLGNEATPDIEVRSLWRFTDLLGEGEPLG